MFYSNISTRFTIGIHCYIIKFKKREINSLSMQASRRYRTSCAVSFFVFKSYLKDYI